jgi:hypothetical protein
MNLLSKTAWIAQVWLTAAMTLIAGIPRFDCRCSEGQAKPFRLVFSASKCCCGRCGESTGNGSRSCCLAASSAKPAKPTSCCQTSRVSTVSKALPASGQISPSACCLKSVTQVQSAFPAHSIRSLAKIHLEPALASLATASFTFAASSSGQSIVSLHSLAPPVNLVTLLQHLLV